MFSILLLCNDAGMGCGALLLGMSVLFWDRFCWTVGGGCGLTGFGGPRVCVGLAGSVRILGGPDFWICMCNYTITQGVVQCGHVWIQ